MKRLMLATTAAIALASPSFAQSSAEATVSETLMTMGYGEAAIDKLTDAQIAELYLVITSEDEGDIVATIEGMNLPGDMEDTALVDTPRTETVNTTVMNLMAQQGYSERDFDALTDAQVAELYLAATSEDESDITEILDRLELGDASAPTAAPISAAAEVVYAELEMRGLDKVQIESISDAEITEIYLALTGGDETDVNRAIDGALNS